MATSTDEGTNSRAWALSSNLAEQQSTRKEKGCAWNVLKATDES